MAVSALAERRYKFFVHLEPRRTILHSRQTLVKSNSSSRDGPCDRHQPSLLRRHKACLASTAYCGFPQTGYLLVDSSGPTGPMSCGHGPPGAHNERPQPIGGEIRFGPTDSQGAGGAE
jgi:hypothetical protein